MSAFLFAFFCLRSAVFFAFATPANSLAVNTGAGGGSGGGRTGGSAADSKGGGGGSGGGGAFFFGFATTIVFFFFLGITTEGIAAGFLFGLPPFLAAICDLKLFSS